MSNFWLLGVAYLCGSIPFGWLLGKLAGVDIRTVGSKNIGATNVLRTCGCRYGVPALLLDAAKGALPVLFLAPWMVAPFVAVRFSPDAPADAVERYRVAEQAHFAASAWAPVLVGLAAVLGHTFPVWFRFKGGKGVATGAGVLGALFWPWPICFALATFVAAVAWKRYISLGSMLAAVVLAAAATALSPAPWGADAPRVGFAWFVAALVIVLHHKNIKRLRAGRENRFSFPCRKKNPAASVSDPAPAPESDGSRTDAGGAPS